MFSCPSARTRVSVGYVPKREVPKRECRCWGRNSPVTYAEQGYEQRMTVELPAGIRMDQRTREAFSGARPGLENVVRDQSLCSGLMSG